ncbi:MAG: hypothetical protein IJY99_01750 [Alphaproteobacteria bacterium]|nr:hypothetical protein [Alphaproteobacteria bacterium]
MKFKNICALFPVLGILTALPTCDVMAAAAKKTAKQSALKKGTTVRAKTEVSGLYNQECYDAYYGCMDQFCISENDSGGTCSCSDLSIEYDKKFAEIQDILGEAERVATEEVEKVKLGAKADIVFTGKREYDKEGNLVDVDDIGKNDKKHKDLMALWESSYDDSDEDEIDVADFSNLKGSALYKAAEELCLEQVPESCEGDMTLLRNMYSRQITSDCKGYENSLATKKKEADLALAQAQGDVRAALKESFEEANKYDLGQCMVQFKKCMQTQDACGENWENCVSTIASENMQNNKAESVAGTKVSTVDKYDITASTMEILNAKRTICENVLGQCVAVRDMVWPAFLREAAPTIKFAETAAESKFRQSCLTNISKCIQKACKDDIEGKGVDSMDACLSRPDMARSFCKVEIDPCERMDPLVWDYVKDKLAAMRVDACTQEVKDCFTHEDRCGKDFGNCIGMDYDYIHDICPIDRLVVCKAANPNFSMDDLDSMLMGLYMNIDNSALEQCQELVDRKMVEVCGDTENCDRFAADETIGAGSLRSQKDGTVYRVTGMISFGSIKMGDATGKTVDEDDEESDVLGPGELGVREYLEMVRKKNENVPDSEEIIATIEEELNNIAGTINRTIEMIEQDPKIQFCVTGRNLSQITGKKNQKTEGRFPNLLTQLKMQIAVSALRQAQTNYNKKLNAEIANATKGASADLAQYMCHKIAQNDGEQIGAVSVETPLAPPYAISYDVGAGLTGADLTKGGLGRSVFKSDNGSGMSKETSAIFNRETRNCHVCTTITTQSCTVKGGNWFRKKNTSCTTETKDPICEDIPM